MRRSFTFAAVGAVLIVYGGVLLDGCVGDEPAAPSDGGSESATNALACKPGDTCASGTCVDGFCCNTTCDGQCEACDVAGHEGTCTPVSGKPHHEACAGDPSGTCAGSCDGKTTVSCTYPTTTCGAGTASCAAGVAQIPPTCANGTCGAATTQSCALGCFQDGCLGVQQVATNSGSACALLTDAHVRCWGDNSVGRLGLGPSGLANYSTPVEVSAWSTGHVKMLGGVSGATCALIDDGTVQCAGSNTSGELGNGTNYGTATPNPTPATVTGLAGATFISSGTTDRFFAIVAGGAVKSWGDNANGALGAGGAQSAYASSFTLRDVCAPGSTSSSCTPATGATFVASGDHHACGVFGGQVACWGDNTFGQLGFAPDGVDHPFPTIVAGIANAITVSAGNSISCATTADGKSYCWGYNSAALGNGPQASPLATPTEICTAESCSTHVTGATDTRTYDDFGCALVAGAVKCWGSNTDGQLGDGTATPSQDYAASTAVGTNALQIAIGGDTAYAVVQNSAERALVCWGQNQSHQCGDGDDGGDTYNKPMPTKW